MRCDPRLLTDRPLPNAAPLRSAVLGHGDSDRPSDGFESGPTHGGITDHESAADRLILYTDDGETLLKAINESNVSYESAILRRATLEDVFVDLTGRHLRD